MPTLQLVRVHEYEDVVRIVKEASTIALNEAGTTEHWDTVFRAAVDLLAARIPYQQVNPGVVSLSDLRLPAA